MGASYFLGKDENIKKVAPSTLSGLRLSQDSEGKKTPAGNYVRDESNYIFAKKAIKFCYISIEGPRTIFEPGFRRFIFMNFLGLTSDFCDV